MLTTTSSKKNLGQYFTPRYMAEFMLSLTKISTDTSVLEPSCGEGIFLDLLYEKNVQDVTAYEIDTTLPNHYYSIHRESFVSANINRQFDLIIGNPPYIRWKNLELQQKTELSSNILWQTYCNSLCDYLYIFILKSVALLKEGGELIFICPEYWMNTTHSQSLRNFLIEHGYFEQIYHFNETPIFENASVSIVVFKYIRSSKKTKNNHIEIIKYTDQKKLDSHSLSSIVNRKSVESVEYFKIPHFVRDDRWVLHDDSVLNRLKKLKQACSLNNDLFGSIYENYSKVGDVCHIANGMVSGLDKAFQIDKETLSDVEKKLTISVIKAKHIDAFISNKETAYIYISEEIKEDFLENNLPNIYHHLQAYKKDLLNRYDYQKKLPYWQWAFLRSFNYFNNDEYRIFVPSKERISNKKMLRFSLIPPKVFATQDVTGLFRKKEAKESIEYILAYLNHPLIFDWVRCFGVVKGNIVEFSEAPLSNIPFKQINWHSIQEAELHEQITLLTRKYIESKDILLKQEIQNLVSILLNV